MRNIFLATSALATLQLGTANLAMAQEEVADEERALDTVVVTANRREQNLQDVPIQITAISGADLEAAGFSEISEILEVVPGASIVSRTAAGFETVQLRGIASGTVGDATVGYYIDNVAFSIPNLQLVPPSRLFDLERAEVLRGPQGTLYGQGAQGGVVRLITNDPDSTKFEARSRGEVSFSDGGDTNYAIDAVVNVPIIKDQLALRVTGGYERLSGFADEVVAGEGGLGVFLGEEDANDAESYNVRAVFKWTPTDKFSATLSGWRIENMSDFANALLPSAIGGALFPDADTDTDQLLAINLATPGGVEPFIDTRLTIGSGFFEYEFPFATLESATSFTFHELDLVTSAAQDTSALFTLPPGSFFSPITNESLFETGSFNHETRLVSNETAPFNWIVGAFVTDANITSNFDVNVFDAIFLTADDSVLETTSFAFFGEISKPLFNGKFTPLFGIRYFRDDRRATGGGTTFASFLTDPPLIIDGTDLGPDVDTDAIFDAVSPRFSFTYEATEDLTFYASATRGFRSGAIQTPGQVALAGVDGVETSVLIDDDSLWTFEGGTKGFIGNFLGGELAFDTAFYFTIWDDIQVPFTTSAGLAATVNGGDARIWGIDAGIVWSTPIDGLKIDASGNFNDTEFTSLVEGFDGVLLGVAEDGDLPDVPESNLTVGFDYRKDVSRGVEAYLSGRYSFRASQFTAGAGPIFGVSDNLDQLSFRAGVNFHKFSIEGFVDNALNDEGPALGVGNVAAPTVQPLFPRTIGLVVTASF